MLLSGHAKYLIVHHLHDVKLHLCFLTMVRPSVYDQTDGALWIFTSGFSWWNTPFIQTTDRRNISKLWFFSKSFGNNNHSWKRVMRHNFLATISIFDRGIQRPALTMMKHKLRHNVISIFDNWLARYFQSSNFEYVNSVPDTLAVNKATLANADWRRMKPDLSFQAADMIHGSSASAPWLASAASSMGAGLRSVPASRATAQRGAIWCRWLNILSKLQRMHV